jgi:preprotein translocase subunit SecG
MATVLLVIHMMIAAGLVGVVLLQKSEGGALGIGGGGGGGFLTGRGTANLLTRTTAILAAAFYATSIAMSLLANQSGASRSLLDKPVPAATGAQIPGSAAPAAGDAKPADATTAPAASGESKPAGDTKPEGRGGILDKLQPAPAPLPR